MFQQPISAENSVAGMRVAGLFAGVGGLELGLKRSGHETILLCEIDPTARGILQRHFPDATLIEDIRSLAELPQVDLISAGFPCQDLSQAGRGAGIRGVQSGLVEELFRLVESSSHKPSWLLLENVPFMLHLGHGAAIQYLTGRFEDLGYEWAYRTIDTRAFGLPQRRRRVLFLASRLGDPRSVLLSENVSEPDDIRLPNTACGFYWTEGNRGVGWAYDAIPPLKGSSGIGIPSPPAIWFPAERTIATPDIRDAERLQGFPVNWTEVEATGKATSRGARWRFVGNAVSVPLAEWIGKQILSSQCYDSSADKKLSIGDTWPAAAWGGRDGAYVSQCSPWPVGSKQHSLVDFLEFPTSPLSSRATLGFLKRLEASRLRVPEAFKDDLRFHAKLSISETITTPPE